MVSIQEIGLQEPIGESNPRVGVLSLLIIIPPLSQTFF